MRTINCLAIATAVIALVGCQKENNFLEVQNQGTQKFFASFENGSDTRTALDVENKVVWSEGDQISVFGGSTVNNSFILNAGAGSTRGEFTVNSLSAGTESNSAAPSSINANVAYYPYDSNVTVSENSGSYTINATFPTIQKYGENSFGKGASPMVAVSSNPLDANLYFKNVGAIFRLQLKGDAIITTVVFSAEADLAGDCQITASNSAVPTVNVTEGSNTIVLDCGDGVQLSNSEATNFIVAMLPVESITGGMTITIYDNAGKKMVYTHKAGETITIERSKAYTTAEVTYNGEQNANTATSVQAALDAATSSTTIQLEPGVNYGTLVFRAIDGQSHTTLEDIADAWAYNYTRSIEDITIIGAAGATVDEIKFETGALPGDQNNRVAIKNLVIDGVEFTDALTASSAGYNAPIMITTSNATIDGLTVKNCKLVGNNDKLNLVYLYGADGSKNVTLSGNTVDGIARLCELRGTENVTISNNIIKNTAEHAMLLAGSGYDGNVSITGNRADGIGDRFVRMSGAGNANVVIKDNVITNYKGGDYDYIKVTDGNNVSIENNTCSFTVSTTNAAQAALDAAINAGGSTTIQLEPGVNYGTLYFRPGTNSRIVDISDAGGDAAGNEKYSKYESIIIIGTPGATVDQFDFQAKWIVETSCGSYIDIKNLTVKNVSFSGERTPFNIDGGKGGWLGIDGLTIDGCTMNDANGADRFVFQQISGYKDLNDKSTTLPVMTTGVKNLTINNCKVTGAYQVIESRAMENLTITNNAFTGIKERDMLIASDATNHPDAKYTGAITITGNTSTAGEERFVRASLNNSAVNVTISNNKITNYKGSDYDFIKVSDASGATITTENNTFAVSNNNDNYLQKLVINAKDGTVFQLNEGDYGVLDFTHTYNGQSVSAKNIKIQGVDGTRMSALVCPSGGINGWEVANIDFYGNSGRGIDIRSGGEGLSVNNCKFTNANIYLNEGYNGITINECTFDSSETGGVYLQNVENVEVTSCTFTNMLYNAIQLSGGGISGSVSITGNTISNCTSRAMRIVTKAGATLNISNNTMTGSNNANDDTEADRGQIIKITGNVTTGTFNDNTHNGKNIVFANGIAKESE